MDKRNADRMRVPLFLLLTTLGTPWIPCRVEAAGGAGGSGVSVSSGEMPELYREWSLVLERFVVPLDGGGTGIRYRQLAVDRGDFDAFLKKLATTDPATLSSRDDQLAFWINVYNAFAIQAILDHDIPASIKDLDTWIPPEPIWKKKWFMVGGKAISLERIEHEILRPTFKEPRIHAAIVCASRSCPDLQPWPYLPQLLDAQLDTAMRSFLANPKGASLDRERGILQLSAIFEWFRKDFEASGSLLQYLDGYLPEGIRSYLASNPAPKVKHAEYDWTLNEAP